MPRVNLSLSQELYDRIEKEAQKKKVTVNYYVCEMLEEKFGKRTTYDYSQAVSAMIKEASKMKKEFTLSDLPTFADVTYVLDEYTIEESPAQVKARLGKMFNEAVRKDNAKGVERAVIEVDGEQKQRFYARAAMYTNHLIKAQQEQKKGKK